MYGRIVQLTPMLLRAETKIAKKDHLFPSGNAFPVCISLTRHFVQKFPATKDGNNLSYNNQTVESRKAAAETKKSQRKRAASGLEHGHESQFGPCHLIRSNTFKIPERGNM